MSPKENIAIDELVARMTSGNAHELLELGERGQERVSAGAALTTDEYKEALDEVSLLVDLDPDADSEAGTRLIALVALIEDYEREDTA